MIAYGINEFIINFPTYPHPIIPKTIYSSLFNYCQILKIYNTYATINYLANLTLTNSGLVF